MAEFPALPLFTDAYLADTRHLTAAQHGAYLLLLMMAWRTPDCALPDDDTLLSRWAAMDLRGWKTNKNVIMAFWKKTKDGRWRQGRLLDERELAEARRDQRIHAGKASALKRHNTRSTPVQREGNENSTNPYPIPNQEEEEAYASSPPTPKKHKSALPSWVPVKEFSDYSEFRKKIKAPLTERAKELAVTELEKLKSQGHNPAEVLNQSILRGWKGLFPLKGDHRHDHQGNHNQPPERWRGPADALTTGFSQALAVIEVQEQRRRDGLLDSPDAGYNEPSHGREKIRE